MKRNLHWIPSSRLWTVLFLGFFLCHGSWVVAQEELPGVFGEVIEVRVVNLEAVVTDRDGIRISGLQPEDFELEVDGEVTAIEFFSEVLGGTAVEAKSAGAVTSYPNLSAGEPVGTSYLLFIDEYFTLARDRNAVLDALIEELALVGPEDRMAVVAYTGHRLEMLTSWSTSVSELARVLKEATRRSTDGMRRITDLRSYRSNRADFAGDRFVSDQSSTDRLDIDEERYAAEVASQVSRVVDAAAATLRGFANPPGRKVMLLLSGGWPFHPAEFAIGSRARFISSSGIDGGEELFRPLSDTANRLGYTLYPVDGPGLSTEVDNADFVRGQGQAVGGFEDTAFIREQNFHDSLGYLAQATGGRVLLNSARLDSLSKAAEDTRSFYWLGFSPKWSGDDETHNISIRVRGRKWKVRSRASFQDLSRQSQITHMVESSLLFGNAPSSRPLEIEVGKGKRAGIGKVEVSLNVRFPAGEIVFLPQENGHVAQLELRVVVINQTGEHSEIPVIPLQLVLPQPPKEDLILGYSTKLKLRKAKHDLVVSVYDPSSSAMLSARKTIHP
ncbi:MAG: VWA domain-containing protein [Deltaproteobacteria bacterium]|nr:VWA domain-containing protein [Deltaproteobacteria bacterium]